jgi:hypothetical protein
MVRSAAVALLTDDIGLALAMTSVALTFGRTTLVTVALLMVLERDSISEESQGAIFTRSTLVVGWAVALFYSHGHFLKTKSTQLPFLS